MTEACRDLQIKQEELGVMRVTINRPEKLNALDSKLLQELCEALEELCRRQDTRVIILDSAGDKAFIAGADIEQMAGMSPLKFREYSRLLSRLAKVMTSSEKVFIGAVRGVTYGGGNIVAMNCDFVFATDKSRFGQQEIDLGILGGLTRLMHLVGPRRAWDLVITGRTIDAAEAEQIGLITKCVPGDELESVVEGYARTLTAKSEVAIRLSKALKKMAENAGFDSTYEYENELISLCFDSEDTKKRLGYFVKQSKK